RAVFGGVALLNDDRIAIEDAGVDHAVAGHLEGVVITAAEQACRDPDRGRLVAQRLDRRSRGNPSVEGQVDGLRVRCRARGAGQRGLEVATDDGRRDPAAFARRLALAGCTGCGSHLFRPLDDLEGTRTMCQPADEATLLETADQAVDAGFGLQSERLLHLLE